MTWLHGGNKELGMLCSTIQVGIRMLQSSYNPFIFLNHTTLSEWYVVVCGFKNTCHKKMYYMFKICLPF